MTVIVVVWGLLAVILLGIALMMVMSKLWLWLFPSPNSLRKMLAVASVLLLCFVAVWYMRWWMGVIDDLSLALVKLTEIGGIAGLILFVVGFLGLTIFMYYWVSDRTSFWKPVVGLLTWSFSCFVLAQMIAVGIGTNMAEVFHL